MSIFLMRALVWVLSVTMPIWAPVKLIAGSPSVWIAMAIRAMEICSPVARSMSISRAGGLLGDLARPWRSARRWCRRGRETTTMTWLPACLARMALRAASMIALGILDARPAELLNHKAHGELSGCFIEKEWSSCKQVARPSSKQHD